LPIGQCEYWAAQRARRDHGSTGYGVSYNVGRVIGSVFPFCVGWLSTGRLSLGLSIPVVAGAGYLCVIVAAWLLPETKGIRLDDVGADPGRAEDFNAPPVPSQRGHS